MNKIGWSTDFLAEKGVYPGSLRIKWAGLWRDFLSASVVALPFHGVSKDEKEVWRAAHTPCAWGAGARTQIGGVLAGVRWRAPLRKLGNPTLLNTPPVLPHCVDFPLFFMRSWS